MLGCIGPEPGLTLLVLHVLLPPHNRPCHPASNPCPHRPPHTPPRLLPQQLAALHIFQGHLGVVEDVAWHPRHADLFGSVGDDKKLVGGWCWGGSHSSATAGWCLGEGLGGSWAGRSSVQGTTLHEAGICVSLSACMLEEDTVTMASPKCAVLNTSRPCCPPHPPRPADSVGPAQAGGCGAGQGGGGAHGCGQCGGV